MGNNQNDQVLCTHKIPKKEDIQKKITHNYEKKSVNCVRQTEKGATSLIPILINGTLIIDT